RSRAARQQSPENRNWKSCRVRRVSSYISGVVAGLDPATPIILTLCLKVRGRRDKPGDDAVGEAIDDPKFTERQSHHTSRAKSGSFLRSALSSILAASASCFSRVGSPLTANRRLQSKQVDQFGNALCALAPTSSYARTRGARDHL